MPNLTHNFTPANLANWTAAKAAIRAGTAHTAYLACLLDSMTDGCGANGNGFQGARAFSYPTRLAQILNADYLPAESDSFFGNANTGIDYSAYDPRVYDPAPWGFYGPQPSLGGLMFSGHSGGPSLDSAMGISSDTLEAFILQNGAFSVAVDGGPDVLTVATPAGNNAMAKFIASAPLGVHTWNIRPQGANLYVVGAHHCNSQRPAVAVLNMGFGGATTTQWADASQPWSPLPSLAVLAASAVLILGCRNNCPSITLDQTAADLTKLIATIRTGLGDPVLIVPSQADPASNFGNAAQQQSYADVFYELSDAHGVGLIDLTSDPSLASYAAAQAAGLMSDGEHYSQAGYRHIAHLIASVIGG